MNTTSLTTSAQYTGSILNPVNYTFQTDSASPPTTVVSLGSATFTADHTGQTVNISGLALTSGNNFCLKIGTSAQDLANNAVGSGDEGSKRCGPIAAPTDFGGNVGPGNTSSFSGQAMTFDTAQAFPRN